MHIVVTYLKFNVRTELNRAGTGIGISGIGVFFA